MKAAVAGAIALVLLAGCGTAAPIVMRPATHGMASAPVSPVPFGGPLAPIENPPFPRSLAAAAFDPLAGQTLMFGGLSTEGALPDTWSWDGLGWTQRHPSTVPHRRFSAVMAFDPDLGGVVLIGGTPDGQTDASVDADMRATWLWRGGTWERLSTAHTPVPDSYVFGWHAWLAYDGQSHELVLVSVRAMPHVGPCTADTWTFDGSDWRHRAPGEALPATVRVLVGDGPGGRVLAVLDPRPALVPAGFFSPACPAGSHDARALPAASTFAWTGSTWTQLGGKQPPPSGNDGDAGGATLGDHAVLVTGGGTVWWWTGSDWVERTASGYPPGRSFAALGQDRNGRLLMFAGLVQSPPWDLGDTWLWDGSVWQQVPTTGQPASASR